MTITPSLFEAFLKCPMKCWLRAANEPAAGNVYAEWVKGENESYRVAETNRMVSAVPPSDCAVSPPAEGLKSAKWRLASGVVVRATATACGVQSKEVPCSATGPSETDVNAGSESLANGSPAPSSARGSPSSTPETSPARLGAALKPAVSLRACDLETCLHLVERAPAEGRGKAAQFVPIRFIFFKLAKDDKVLLAYDAFVLRQALGRDIAVGKIIHGDDHATLKVKTSALIGGVRKSLEKIATLLFCPAPPDLVLNRHCAECEFEARCRKISIEKDDLSLLAGMRAKERQKLRSKGIFTVTQLSYTFRPRRRPKRLRDKREKYHHSLKALAIREKKIHIVGSPELKIEGTPVYLDVEGMPDRGFYYLIGLRIGSGDSAIQHSLWADTVEDERRIWGEFLAILETIEKPALIHYGSYETAFFRDMNRRYGSVPEASAVGNVLKRALNALSVIFAQIYFPTFSNGLKEIVGSFGFKWGSAIQSGTQAIVERRRWEQTGNPALKDQLVLYNALDCGALDTLIQAIRTVCKPSAETKATEELPCVINVDGLEPYRTMWPKFASPIAEFEEVNRAARWDYQRDHVVLRSTGRRNGPVRRSRPSIGSRLRAGKVVTYAGNDRCPKCNGVGRPQAKQTARVLNDIAFGTGGVRARLVQYYYRNYQCSDCGFRFGRPAQFWSGSKRGSKYGVNLVALMLYEAIDLGIHQRTIARHASRIFGLNIHPSLLPRFKREAAEFYRGTREMILDRIRKGPLVHVDETRANVLGKQGYVWVFTSLHEVAYLYSDSREGSIAHAALGAFSGVLVSDFFSVYDSFECPQQKCLLHLIRDMNRDLLDHPYNEEFKRLAKGFGELLKDIVGTVDRRGLKKHFLRKHKKDVLRFYRTYVNVHYDNEVATKCSERLRQNRGSLFTFLDHDGVPWHNNNAEHAIKAFAGLRDVMQGSSTSAGIDAYLILLSVCETCRYMGLDFLDFLRSGEKDIYAFAGVKSRQPRKALEYPPTIAAAPLGPDGSYWLDLFTGKTWMEFRAAGSGTTGFRPRMRNSVARIRRGDILLCYLTGAMRWVGALQVVGHSNDKGRIWTEFEFPERLEVKPLIVLEPENGVPMSELAEKAPLYRNDASFKKFKGFLRGCPKRFKNRRNGEIILRMLFAAQRTPVNRAVDPKELAKNSRRGSEQC